MVHRQWVIISYDWSSKKFFILKKKGGNVAFGDESSTKILGKGTVKLGTKNVKSRNSYWLKI
jgi:hypothetical protein